MDGSWAFGLGALGFWLFIGAASVAGIWDGIRKREAEHETLRRLAETGQPLDQSLIDELTGANKPGWRDLRVAGLIVLWTSPGFALLGVAISFLSADAIFPLMGVALLALCVATGLLLAARFAEREFKQDRERSGRQ